MEGIGALLSELEMVWYKCGSGCGSLAVWQWMWRSGSGAVAVAVAVDAWQCDSGGGF
jgi:hypothetical protein